MPSIEPLFKETAFDCAELGKLFFATHNRLCQESSNFQWHISVTISRRFKYRFAQPKVRLPIMNIFINYQYLEPPTNGRKELSMHYAPQSEPCPLEYSPFKSCTVPRPIRWLSTVSKSGTPNLAPFSQWQNQTFDPPMVMFAANQLSSGERKHTVVNAEETGWFV